MATIINYMYLTTASVGAIAGGIGGGLIALFALVVLILIIAVCF